MNTAQHNGFDPFLLEEKPFDLRGFLFKYILRYWYLYLFFLAAGVTGAWLYLRYSIPKFEAKGTILIKSDKQSSGLTEEKLLGELGFLTADKNLENEMQILKSRTLMREVVDELNLDVQFISIGRVVESEYYNESPVRLDSFIKGDKKAAVFELAVGEISSFQFMVDSLNQRCQYGIPFSNAYGTFLISRNEHIKSLDPQIIQLKILDPENVATGYAARTSVVPASKFSNVLELKLIDPKPRKAEDILNKLVEVYNQAAVEDKNKISTNTLRFIEDRLLFLTRELGDVEKGLEQFKKSNQIPLGIEATSDMLSSEFSNYDKELSRLEIQLNILTSVQGYLESKATTFDYVPANIGINSPAVNDLFSRFNDLLIQKDRLLRSGTPDNPIVSGIDAQLRTLRENILAAIRDELRNLQLTRNQTELKNRQITSRTGAVPRIEREFLEIYRQQNIKEQLYLFLLQKREETALTMAVTPSNARVIDAARAGRTPVEPKPQLIYAIGLLLGLGLPALIIVVLDLLDDKIRSQQDIENETKAPILGGISHSRSDKTIVVGKGSRSSIAEMFRLLRTNLQFMGGEKGNKVIMVTSSASGEGKTFITANLGLSLALSGKKTVLLGLDMRKPKLKKYITDEPEDTGIANYLIGDMSIQEVVRPTGLDSHLFYIPTGPVPPNPAELMMGQRMEQLMEELKRDFDLIVIDTPPVGLVADALLLDKFVDSSLFVIRAGQTRKGQISIIDDIYKNKKLKNVGVVFNGLRAGKGYGYGYYDDDKIGKKKKSRKS